MLFKCGADTETETLSISAEAARTTNPVIELPNCSCMKTGLSEPVFVLTDARSTYIHTESKTGHYAVQEPELIPPSHHERFVRAKRSGGLRETGGP